MSHLKMVSVTAGELYLNVAEGLNNQQARLCLKIQLHRLRAILPTENMFSSYAK